LAFAARLSQGLPESSVLLLEAGPAAPNVAGINIPGLQGSEQHSPFDWNFTTVPQIHTDNKSWELSRGKVLGGTAALHYLTWDRGSIYEYDAWETLGNKGWNWSMMIQGMLKSENFLPSKLYGDEGVGTGGPIDILIDRYQPPQQSYFHPAMENLKIRLNNISLAGNPIGAVFQPSSIRHSDYKRSYSAHGSGYLPLAGSNLQIRTSTRVRKVNSSQVQVNGVLVASGVTLEDNSTISASREVILSAGSLQSPGLLELSGIGNEQLLSEMEIPCLQDLPGVGKNLQDHIKLEMSYQYQPNFTSLDILKYNTSVAATQLSLYNANLSSLYDHSSSALAFVNWTQISSNDSHLQALVQHEAGQPSKSITDPFEYTRAQLLLKYLRVETANVPQLEVVFNDGYAGVKGYPPRNSSLYGADFFTLVASILHPFSTGSVHIASPSITIQPTINPNYLSREYDIEAAVTSAKYLRKIANTSPLNQIWTSEYEPGLEVVGTGPDTDEQWRAWITSSLQSTNHPVGTCAMIPRRLGGVVDADLRVYGTSNLRVVDASIFPVLISAHPQTLIYGIAEIAAEKVVATWK
jgi:choline dehydrogenase-like flavoprotein